MERTDLKTIGDPLQTIISMEGGNVAQYYRVACNGYFVGVGLFHNHNSTCTFALVRNEAGERQMLGRISEEYPLEVSELHQLEAYFYEMFPVVP